MKEPAPALSLAFSIIVMASGQERLAHVGHDHGEGQRKADVLGDVDTVCGTGW